ncbi:MAG: cytochrome C [Rhodoplanes sp.]
MFSEIVLSCFIIATMSAGIAQAQQVGSAQDGLQFAREACAECHLVDKTVGESPNTDAPTFEAIAKTPGLTSMALAVALQTSHRAMPNIVVKSEDAQNITAYILSLREAD